MQCDRWSPPEMIPLGTGQFGSPPVLVKVASNSRFICAHDPVVDFRIRVWRCGHCCEHSALCRA